MLPGCSTLRLRPPLPVDQNLTLPTPHQSEGGSSIYLLNTSVNAQVGWAVPESVIKLDLNPPQSIDELHQTPEVHLDQVVHTHS